LERAASGEALKFAERLPVFGIETLVLAHGGSNPSERLADLLRDLERRRTSVRP
jgi:hypothetical protein